MRAHRTTLLCLTFVGSVIIAMAGYVQFASMDLTRFRAQEYLAGDVGSLVWWRLVLLPMIFGVGVVVLTLRGLRGSNHPTVTLRYVGLCLLLSVLLLALGSPFGIFACVATLLLSVAPVLVS